MRDKAIYGLILLVVMVLTLWGGITLVNCLFGKARKSDGN